VIFTIDLSAFRADPSGCTVDTSPTHYAEVASDCLWWPAVGADE